MGSATTATKSNAIRRLLLCFRPNVAHDDDDDVSSIPTMNPHRLTTKDAVAAADLLTSIAVEEKERFVLPGASPAGPDDNAGLPRKESSKRFSKIIKSVMFETSLSNKMRKRKNSPKSSPTPEAEESSAETTPHATAESDNGGGGAGLTPSSSSSSGSLTETCTDSPSSSFTVGSSSSISGSSFPSISRTTSLQCGKSFEPSPEEPPKQPAPAQPRNVAGSRSYNSIGNQCLFLLSLAALIFFGKACAIFCTSTCFYFVPRLSRPRTERSEEIRKRIQM